MDREIAHAVLGPGKPQQAINQACRQLESKGLLVRKSRPDGYLGNFPASEELSVLVAAQVAPQEVDNDSLSEDSLKAAIQRYLVKGGWKVKVAWGHAQGIDIDASRAKERWIIEVKGRGSRDQARVNYFLAILGETLQRMTDPTARYSIALPDLAQFRGLWQRLPRLAKERTQITCLFVRDDGTVGEME